MKKFILLALLFVGGMFMVYKSSKGYLVPGYHRFIYTPSAYESLKISLEDYREKVSENFRAKPKAVKIAESRHALETNLDRLFTFWYGTKWDLNGTTTVPGRGKIACGYFVTTVLRDAGFPVERVKWAQLASESMIKNLTDEKHIRRFSGTDLPDFIEALKKQGDGIYVVGLDTHTGFLKVAGESVTFIHSAGLNPQCVIREDAANSRTLRKSKYRVTTKLSADEEFLLSWYK